MSENNNITQFYQLHHFYWWQNCSKTINGVADYIEDMISLDLSDNNEDSAIALKILHCLRELASIAHERADELELPIKQFDNLCMQCARNKKRSDKAVNS